MITAQHTSIHFPLVIRKVRACAATALGAAALAAVGAGAAAAVGGTTASAAAVTNAVAKPSAYGYPDATNSGVPAGTTLKSVPSQVSSGPGWSWNASSGNVVVNGNGAVLSGLYIPGNVNITAANVTIQDVHVVASGNYGISIRHAAGVTIKDSSVDGQNATTGRLNYGIDDIYGDATGITIQGSEVSNFRTAMQITTGTIEGNYIHHPGYLSGDHTNGVYVAGGTQPLTIAGNTILNSLGETDAVYLDAPNAGTPVANKTVENNLLGGGDYPLYAGNSRGNATSNIIIENNRFTQNYYPKSGYYGPVIDFAPAGQGNTWSGNVWDSTGQVIPAP